MNATDLGRLEGKVVLVCSEQDHRNPPTGLRGTIHLREGAAAGKTQVEVELEFPQMFSTRAHRRVVALDDDELAGLLDSEQHGTFSVTLKDLLDPDAPPANE